MTSVLEQVLAECPSSEFVKIKNARETEDIIIQLIESGTDLLQVIADFDLTLTRYQNKGVKCQTCYELFSSSPLLPPELTKKITNLHLKNAHMLVDPSLTIEDKTPLLEEWYRQGHDILTSYKITKSLLHKIAQESLLLLRENTTDMIQMLSEAKIPLLIFSGGLGNFIEDILQNSNAFGPNLKIIANYMEFNDSDELTGFTDPIIHSYNKGLGISPETSEYFVELAKRTNAILLGDSLGDISMSDGILHPESILKIGFLNHNIDECLEEFMTNFDIVLVDDQPMDFINILLKYLLKKK